MMFVSLCHTKMFIAAFIVVTALGAVCKATCSSTEATPYVPISKPYDRNYSSITSTGTHPLGFYRGTWYYNQQGMANPCFSITGEGAATGKLEIMVETVPSARLCVKDQASSSYCFQGRSTYCRDTPGNTIYVEFLCDSSCEETDVSFWYRLRLSPPGEDPELFCFNKDSEYPEDLLTLPPGATFPPATIPGEPSGQGATLQPFILLTVFLGLCQFWL